MSNLQHDRITELCRELRLGAMADLYGPIAQHAAKKKDASYSDFLEEVLRAEREAKRCRAREMLTRVAGFPTIRPWMTSILASPPGRRKPKSKSSRR
jgi:DNA replication protein DnaC